MNGKERDMWKKTQLTRCGRQHTKKFDGFAQYAQIRGPACRPTRTLRARHDVVLASSEQPLKTPFVNHKTLSLLQMKVTFDIYGTSTREIR
jgi:hypothetical protein